MNEKYLASMGKIGQALSSTLLPLGYSAILFWQSKAQLL